MLNRFPTLLWAIIFMLIAHGVYLCGVFLGLINAICNGNTSILPVAQKLVWTSGMPLLLGLLLALFDFFVQLPQKRVRIRKALEPYDRKGITVTLTAYNDEESIGAAVDDFLAQPEVKRVIVVDNNSSDRTAEIAASKGATVVIETQQGYGHCVYRCLTEGIRYPDTAYTLLSEGDMTFRAADIDKFLAYLRHADIVNGTRIVEQLREETTQLSTFIYYGNFFVGKLLEAKHLGKGTFTDVGTTFKLLRNETIIRLLPVLNPYINLEFNAHFLDIALAHSERIVECPVTFFPRWGISKGGNKNNLRAAKVGLSMILGLLFGWSTRRAA